MSISKYFNSLSREPDQQIIWSTASPIAKKSRIQNSRMFADLLAIEENTLTRWERGETEPGFDMLLRICQVLDTTPNELLLGSAPVERLKVTVRPKRKSVRASERPANRA
jgi:transcriptional regulator with XRE-family HTH domain